MSPTAPALWLAPPGKTAVCDETPPSARPDERLVRRYDRALSRGAEALVYGGHVPERESARVRARCLEPELAEVEITRIRARAGAIPAGPAAEPDQEWPCRRRACGKGRADWVDHYGFCLFPQQTRCVVAAHNVLHDILGASNLTHLANHSGFAGWRPTTECVARVILERMHAVIAAVRFGDGAAGLTRLGVRLSESPIARAGYEAPL